MIEEGDSRPTEKQEETQSSIRTIQIIYWGLFSVLFVYAGVAFFLTDVVESGMDAGTERIMFLVMILVSVGAVVGAFVFRTVRLKPEHIARGETELKDTLQNYQAIYIVQGGLFDAIAIYGLLMTILTGQFWYVPGFAVPAALLFLLVPPSRNDFERRREKNL